MTAWSVEELSNFFEMSIDMLTIAGTDGYFKRVNPAFLKTLGYSEAELLGQPFNDFVHPDDKEATLREIDRLSFGIPTVYFSNRYRAKNGAYHWLNWTAYPKGDRIYAIARDVTVAKAAKTQLEEKNERLRSILETVRDVVLMIDEHGLIQQANRSTLRVLGYTEEELIGRDIRTLIKDNYHDFLNALLRDFSSMAPSEQKSFLEDARLIEGLSRRGVIMLEFLAHEMHFGGRRYFTVLLRDFSRRQRAEHEQKRFYEEIEAFIYAASNDLRTPLRHINGYVELLQEGYKPVSEGKSHGRYLAMIKDVSLKMNQLLDGLHAFSQIGRGLCQKSETDFNAMVHEVIGELSPMRKGVSVRWQVDLLPLLPVNPPLFRVVWQNLLSNAIKFTSRQAQPFIHIGVRNQTAKTCEIFVRDNGVGFESRYAPQLFQMFRRLHASSEFEGLGLGLAQSKKIVELNGGKISAEGEVGQGATFYVTLPRQLDSSAP